MIHLTRALIRRWLDALLHIDDTPERTAAAFALGVFFGFSPFLGFHTILGILFAFLLNLNRVAVLLGVYSNLPWLLAPYYFFTTRFVGAPITLNLYDDGTGVGQTYHNGTASVTQITRNVDINNTISVAFTCEGNGALTHPTA